MEALNDQIRNEYHSLLLEFRQKTARTEKDDLIDAAEAKIKQLEEEEENLGLFKGKRRKEIKAQVEKLQAELEPLREQVNAAREEAGRPYREKMLALSDVHPLLLFLFAETGDTLRMGKYVRKPDEPAEPLAWRVLERTESEVTVITADVIDQVNYNEEAVPAVWETSSLRAWLNGEFFQSTFTPAEQQVIELVDVPAGGGVALPEPDAAFTKDRLFCLSAEEAKRLLPTNASRKARVTHVAYEKMVIVSDDGTGSMWWLRSRGDAPTNAATVYIDGSVDEDGWLVNISRVGVRPVFKVKLV